MDSVLSNAVTALVMSLVTGASVYAFSYLTSKSEVFAPVRDYLKKLANHGAMVERLAELHDLPKLVNHGMVVVRFAADLMHCTFCSSWWHALWLTPVFITAIGGDLGLYVVVDFAAVGVAAVIDRMRPAPAQTLPQPQRAKTLQEMARDYP